MPVTEHPRTEPDVRHSRIRLPPWMFDGEALVGPGVRNAWPWQPLVRELVDPVPPGAVLLAAPGQRAHPEHHDVGTGTPPGHRRWLANISVHDTFPSRAWGVRRSATRDPFAAGAAGYHDPQPGSPALGSPPNCSRWSAIFGSELVPLRLPEFRQFPGSSPPLGRAACFIACECEHRSRSGKCCRTSHHRCRRRLGENCSPAMQMRTRSGRTEYPYRTIFADLGIPVADSPAGENGRALFDKGLRRFAVVLGAAGLHLVHCFHIE